jgi:transmembrane sensor
MNQAPNLDVMADAERWYARLKSPDCDVSERMEFQRWRAVHAHAAAYAATEKLWHSLGQLAGHPDLGQLSRQILADTAEHSRPPWRRIAIAASILIILLGGGVFLTIQNRQTPAVVYATQSGERSTIKLADGSQVVLNFATELDVRINKKVRRLTLHKGEAIFTVEHDDKRPFKVMAGDGEVTALGTRFQVRNEAKQVAVTLLEGRVAVERPKESERIQLTRGDQVTFTEAMPDMRQRKVDPEVAASWATGRLLFRSTPLSEVLETVNRYSATQIRIADPALADLRINGTFEIGDGLSVASALEALLPVQAVKKSDGEVLLRHR